jgi:hypothetical protein
MRKKMKLYSAVAVLALSIILTLNLAYAQSPDDDVFAVIKLNDPGAFIPSVGQFIDKFQPGMGGMVNPMMVGNMVFKNPNWAGMDMAGEYTAVVLNPMKYSEAPFAIIVPITNKDEYLGALSQTLTGGEEVEGVYTFTQPDQKSVYVAFAGDKGIFSESSDVAAQAKMLVEGDSAALAEKPVVKGQLAVLLSMDKIFVTVRPMIDMFKQQMLMGMQQEMQSGEGAVEGEQPPAAGMQQMIQAEVDMFLSLLEQTEKLQFGLNLEENGLRLSKAVFAMSGSAMEKFMAVQAPKKSSLLGYIPADSAVLGSGSINLTPEFIDGYIGLFYTMSEFAEDSDKELIEKSAAWIKQTFELIDGNFAFGGLSQEESSLFAQIWGIKDQAQVKQLLEEYPEMMKSMTGLYESMGMDMTMELVDKAEVKGGEIYNYSMGMSADMIPDPEGREAFTAIFGDKISSSFGITKNYGVGGFGKAPRAQVEKLMEQVDSGAEVAAQFTPSMFGLPEENNMFVYLSIPKVMEWASKNVPDAPQYKAAESPGLGMAGRFVESHFEGELFLPVDEIMAIQAMGEELESLEESEGNY